LHHRYTWFVVCLGLLSMNCSGGKGGTNSEQELLPAEFSLASCPVECSGTVEPSCEGDILVGECVGGQRSCTDCMATNETCVYDPLEKAARCALRNFVEVDCIPECAGKVCGDDQCGGSCGFCPDGGICDGGSCLTSGMECDGGKEPLRCIGEVLASCINDSLNFLDCAALGRVCGQSPSTGKKECLVP